MIRKREIGLRSYQDIPPDPRYEEPSTQDYFEMFFSAWSGKEEVSDDDYEIVHRWWYEFKAGTGCDWDDGVNVELEEMKNDLKEFDQGREIHSCETCRRFGKCDSSWKNNCRTGHNDDYTCTDYWKIHRTDEEWEEEIWKEKNKKIKLSHENWKAKKIIKEFIDILKVVKISSKQYDALSETLKKAEQFLEEK